MALSFATRARQLTLPLSKMHVQYPKVFGCCPSGFGPAEIIESRRFTNKTTRDRACTPGHLGYLALYMGNTKEARNVFIRFIQDFYDDKIELGTIFSLEGMADLYRLIGRPEEAARLAGFADAARQRMSVPRPPLEQTHVDFMVKACIAKMGKRAFMQAYDGGQRMSLDEAVADAFKVS